MGQLSTNPYVDSLVLCKFDPRYNGGYLPVGGIENQLNAEGQEKLCKMQKLMGAQILSVIKWAIIGIITLIMPVILWAFFLETMSVLYFLYVGLLCFFFCVAMYFRMLGKAALKNAAISWREFFQPDPVFFAALNETGRSYYIQRMLRKLQQDPSTSPDDRQAIQDLLG
ncbi:MAG: hypothetical protein Q8P73_00100 [bacterium]|nr:hypothetical protein [bacterium]MDZ4346945.1 hypothetical protein [Candidatus Binatia bacterium]